MNHAGISSQSTLNGFERRVILASPRGFCAGVVRAIEAVEDALAVFGPPVFVRRPIVHNHAVVADLESKGAIFVQELSEIPVGAVVILSAHGVAPTVRREAESRKLQIFDAVCPLVAKVHREVRAHTQAGRVILLVGHEGHPEIVGTLGHASSASILVVSDVAAVAQLDLRRETPMAYAVQTTFSLRDADKIIDVIRAHFDDVVGPRASDICYATTNRQTAIETIAAEACAVIVVGDRISSNANRLVEVSRSAGCPAVQLVACEGDIDWTELSAARAIGLTAAASTPERSVTEVLDALGRHFPIRIEAFGQVEERTTFRKLSFDSFDQKVVGGRKFARSGAGQKGSQETW